MRTGYSSKLRGTAEIHLRRSSLKKKRSHVLRFGKWLKVKNLSLAPFKFKLTVAFHS